MAATTSTIPMKGTDSRLLTALLKQSGFRPGNINENF